MERANENVESINQSNDGYTTAGVIQLRLDTGPLLDQLEAFFRGTRIIGYKEDEIDKAVKPVFGKVGVAKMNDEGVQSLMSWLTPLFSPHTVQGNFEDFSDFVDYMVDIEEDIFVYIMLNRTKWEISITEIDGICDGFRATANRFFSRSIGNKERESYSNTITSVERSRSERGGGIPFLS